MNIIRDVSMKAEKYLKNDEILLFIGARQAGKTTILKQIKRYLEKDSACCTFLNLEDPEYLDLLNENPKNLLKILSVDRSKRNYIFIDEVQYLKSPSNFLKYFHDEYKGVIKLIVSGSSAFYIDDKFKDSLAGRKKIFHVATLSFREFLRFKAEDALVELLPTEFKDENRDVQVGRIDAEKISLYYREYLLFGGYPRVVLSPLEEKNDLLRELAFSYIKKDIHDSKVRQDQEFYKLLTIMASQIGCLVNSQELANTLGVSKTLVNNYLVIMQKSLYLVFIKPFYNNVRKELTKMPKVYFQDLGLRNFFTRNFESIELRNDNGQILENAVYRQFANYFWPDEIKFWRTADKHEVDFIIKNSHAFEVKTKLRDFKIKNYRSFFDAYPKIRFNIAVLEKAAGSRSAKSDFPVWESWKI